MSDRKKIVLSFLLAAIWLVAPLSPHAKPVVDATQRVKILMRVLTYDRNLDRRAVGGKIFVAVVFEEGKSGSTKERDEVVAALKAVSSIKVKGSTLAFEAVPFSDAGALQAFVDSKKAAALYICSGLGGALRDIGKIAAKSKIATLTGTEKLVREGLAVGVVDRDGKGEIIVNLPVAKNHGMDLESSLLRLAEVIR